MLRSASRTKNSFQVGRLPTSLDVIAKDIAAHKDREQSVQLAGRGTNDQKPNGTKLRLPWLVIDLISGVVDLSDLT